MMSDTGTPADAAKALNAGFQRVSGAFQTARLKGTSHVTNRH